MEVVERILGKIVGRELNQEEMELVSGGIFECPKTLYYSESDFANTGVRCDEYN